MKRLILALCFVLSMFSMTLPAHAQFVVVDPTNLAQNILTAARTLQAVNNQIQQLQNEARMLADSARNLEHLDLNTLHRLEATLDATEQLLDQARGLQFDIRHTVDEFARLYPAQYAEAVTRGQLNADRVERWSFSREALGTTMALQAQAKQNFASDESVLRDLVSSSQSAAGALQAAQATNQLLALQSRQLMQTQQLQIAQDRAIALEQARTVAAEERSHAIRRRFMSSSTPYTPQNVQGF
jgi:type IV secretion system protein TrbJ